MALLINRAASVLVVGVYLIVTAITGGIGAIPVIVIYSLLPLACIWFPDEMGSLTYARGLPLNESPGCLVTAGGWLLLLLPLIVQVIWYFRG